MRKIISLLIIFVSLFLSGCKKTIYCSDVEFVNKIYETINTDGINYLMIDLRCSEDYLEEHIKVFMNLDRDKLEDYISLNTNENYLIFIFCEEKVELNYKNRNIYIYNGSYEQLKNTGMELLKFDTGEYDCGC